MMLCSVADCERKQETRGWCDKHYRRWKKHGDPEKTLRYVASDIHDAFDKRTEVSGDCLIWTGCLGTRDYGLVTYEGKGWQAHRLAWTLANGPIPKGYKVDHRCFNHSCVKLEHLRLATNKQNGENREGLPRNNTSGYRGVTWAKDTQRWQASVKHHGKNIYLGQFDDIEEANRVAVAKRLELFTHNDTDRLKNP